MSNIFQLFETMCYQFLCKESTIFTTKTHFLMLFERILATLLVEALDGDSFVSQSRFGAYAVFGNLHKSGVVT